MVRETLDITREELVKMYCYENLSDTDVSKKYGCTPTAIGYYRKKWGIKKLFRDKDWLNEQYNEKKRSLVDIAKEINCKEDTIGIYLRKFGYQTGHARRGNAIKHYLNEDIFEKIDTPEKAYWLGFITADGCISDDKKQRKAGYTYHYHRLMFNLSKKDRYMVEALRYFISGEDIPIKDVSVTIRGKSYEQSHLRIASKKLTDDLMAHGVLPRKSLHEMPPVDVPEFLYRHFVRGEFDGDGCVGVAQDNLRITIVGSEQLMAWIKEQFGSGYVREDNKIKNFFSFNLYRQDEVTRFYHWLYDGATIFLKRKKDIFDSHIHEPIDRRDSPTSSGNIGEPGGNDLAADSAA